MNDTTKTENEDRGDDFIPDESPVEPETPETPADSTEPAPPPVTGETQPSVPHARFEELNQRLKLEQASRLDMEAKLNALLRQEEAKKTPPFDAAAAEKDYLKAVVDGDMEQAARLMSTIRRHERQQLEQDVTERTQRQIEQATARAALETVAEAAIQQYPFLDPQHASANQTAISEVVEWRDYYLVAKGMTPAKALKAAVDRIAPTYAKTPPAAPTITSGARTQAQRQTNAQASVQQPPALDGIGERAARQARTDVTKMTDAEFAALSAAEKAKLRGDAVT